MNQERLLQILLSPQISEKATYLAEKRRQVVFAVVRNATKPEIKFAVEKLFNVSVISVQVLNVKGKRKKFGRFVGKRNDWKKAHVALKDGHVIDFTEKRDW